MSEALLEIDDLRVSFDSPTGLSRPVDGVSLSIEPGQTLGLVGESGCGKSVTAMSILRLIEGAQTTGRIAFRGRNLADWSEYEMTRLRGGKIAMMFQEPGTCLNPVRSVGAQIAESIHLHRSLSRRAAATEVIRLLAEVHIPNPSQLAGQFPHELSGGMKQRAMIAMALAGEPDLLIADEPTTALDVTVQAEILRLLRRIQDERQLAILLITHDLGVVAEMAHIVAVMYAGRIVEQAETAEIFRSPRHPYTVGLLGSLPAIDGKRLPAPIEGTVPLPTDWPSGCRFRERCVRAFHRCAEDPRLEPVSPAHLAACWLQGPE